MDAFGTKTPCAPAPLAWTTEQGLRYAIAHARMGAPPRMVLLHIGDQDTVVVAGSGAVPDATISLALGAKHTAARFFRHDLPSPLELETAIETVEVEVSRARHLTATPAILVSADPTIRALATISAIGAAIDTAARQDVQVMTLAQVESFFQRLASASLGHPSAHRGMPEGCEAAAVLLILREFMHHLGFDAISVLQSEA